MARIFKKLHTFICAECDTRKHGSELFSRYHDGHFEWRFCSLGCQEGYMKRPPMTQPGDVEWERPLHPNQGAA